MGRVNLHQQYFQPEFQPRTTWPVSDGFASAFKELAPLPQDQATARLAPFLETQLN